MDVTTLKRMRDAALKALEEGSPLTVQSVAAAGGRATVFRDPVRILEYIDQLNARIEEAESGGLGYIIPLGDRTRF